RVVDGDGVVEHQPPVAELDDAHAPVHAGPLGEVRHGAHDAPQVVVDGLDRAVRRDGPRARWLAHARTVLLGSTLGKPRRTTRPPCTTSTGRRASARAASAVPASTKAHRSAGIPGAIVPASGTPTSAAASALRARRAATG